MSASKKGWKDMSKTEKTIGLVAVGVIGLLIVWFVVAVIGADAPTANEKIKDNADSVVEDQ